ncbi:MAG: UDP-N-acetylmuramoyl-L-alanine--D-glutamate ligase [Candidatus Fermentibacter sp.]|nr:UDP-N-acetylmuramoyl-L-alanine--D-glutamate ligase [Candidatus Fermentibacter sp.]
MHDYWTRGGGRRMGVAGLGRSGRAAARLLATNGFAVVGFDDDKSVAPCEWCGETWTGEDCLGHIGGLEGLVLSPGIPSASPMPRAAVEAGIPVTGEIELASRYAQAPILAVTGSNGKTTTSEWLGHVLNRAGIRACVAGNVGYPFCLAVIENPYPEWFVLEVSSYQLETADSFRPSAAAILNLTPDHLLRHGDMEGYRNAKARIFMNQHSEDLTVLNSDDPESLPLMGLTRGMEALFSRQREVREGADCLGGTIVIARDGSRSALMKASALSLPGRHNLENALAVACLAGRAGIAPEALAEGLSTFGGVPHRIETVRILDGVTWVNDSKSTNQDSLKVALESFDRPVILIAGGLSKKTSYGDLAWLVSERVRDLILIGSATEELALAWAGTAPMHRAGDMEGAVRLARSLAGQGDVVLLSPACASFDQYENFERRGEHFRSLVEALR